MKEQFPDNLRRYMCGALMLVELGSEPCAIWANDDACRLFSYAEGVLDGKPFSSLLNGHDCARTLRKLRDSLGAPTEYSDFVRIILADGSQRLATLTARCFRQDGELQALVSFGRAGRQTEFFEEMKQEIQKLKTLVANVPCGFFSYDITAGGSFIEIGSGMPELLGFSNESELRREYANNYFNMILPDDRSEAKLTVFNQLRESERSEVFYRVRGGDGAIRWLYEKGHAASGENGNVFYVAVLDVTEWYQARFDLEETSLELDTIAENLPGGLAVFEVEEQSLRLLYGNDTYFRLLGATRASKADELRKAVSHEDYARYCELTRLSAAERKPFKFTFGVAGKNGTRWCEATTKIFKEKQGVPISLAIIVDVTERKRYEQELALTAQRYKLIEDCTNETLFEYDPASDVVIIPGAAEGRRARIEHFRELSGRITEQESGYASFDDGLRAVLERPCSGSVDFRTDAISGHTSWYKATYVSVPDENGIPLRIIGKIRNVTAEREERSRLKRLATIDLMTDLLNKSAFKQAVDEFLSTLGHSGHHAVILMDIDDFKAINDTYGHPFGDTVIFETSHMLRGFFRSSDLIGRISGDEFMALLKDISREEAIAKGREINGIAGSYSVVNKGSIKVTVSAGIAFYNDDATTFDGLYKCADIALYEAKRKGKNAVLTYNRKLASTPEKSKDDE